MPRPPKSATSSISPKDSVRGIEADFGPENADIFRRSLPPYLRAA